MKLLINRKDIEKNLQLSIHRNEKDIERFVKEVQLFDSKKKFCEDFFLDLVMKILLRITPNYWRVEIIR